MSASDPKLWEEPDDDPEVLTFAYGIARRRALAELKAIVARFDDLWFDGAAEAIAVIHDRIAEIEAEG